MIASARITMDEEYLGQKYDDWARYVSRWRRFELPVAIGILCIGLLALLFVRAEYAGAFIAIGAFDTLLSATSRRRWLRKMKSVFADGSTTEIEFATDGMTLRSSKSSGTVEWSLFSESIATPTGLFLRHKETSIYVPDHVLVPREAKDEIARKLGARIQT